MASGDLCDNTHAVTSEERDTPIDLLLLNSAASILCLFFLPDIFYEGFFSCVRSCYIHNITKRQSLQNVAPPVMFLELSEHTLLEGL